MSIRIPVTQAHIDAAERGYSDVNPIALAVGEAFGKPCEVSGGCIHVDRQCCQDVADTTTEMDIFLSDFNAGKAVKPFVLEVTLH